MRLIQTIGALTVAFSLPFASQAQFEAGDNVLGVGVGILGGYGVGWNGSDYSESPAINAHFDHGMGDLGPGIWGLGGYVGYKTASYKAHYLNYYQYDYRYTWLIIGVRGTWHYNEWHGDKLDTYGGLMLAYRGVNFKDHTDYGTYGYLNTYSYSGSGIGFSGFLGARYYFSDKIGAFGELGYGLTALQLGLAVKL
jgi:hypothetical protein